LLLVHPEWMWIPHGSYPVGVAHTSYAVNVGWGIKLTESYTHTFEIYNE
jgi:hypothetical protein